MTCNEINTNQNITRQSNSSQQKVFETNEDLSKTHEEAHMYILNSDSLQHLSNLNNESNDGIIEIKDEREEVKEE